jgi:hypothetical protein
MKRKYYEAPHYLTFSILRFLVFLSGTNTSVLLSAMFLNPVALWDEVGRRFKTAGRIAVLCNLIFTSLDGRREHRRL